MKRLAFFPSLLATLMIVLCSCSKDDNTPPPGTDTTAFNIIFSNISVLKNYQATPPTQSKQLADILTYANKDKAPYVKSVEIQLSDSYITVEGSGFETLRNITVNLLDSSSKPVYSYNVNLDSVSPSDSSKVKDSTNPCVTFLNAVANYLATKKSINMQITLDAGDQDLMGLTVTIHTNAIFSW